MRTIEQNPFVERYDHKMIGKDRVAEVEKIVSSLKATSASFKPFENALPKIIVVKAGYGIGKTFTSYHLKQKLKSELNFAISSFRLIDDQSKGVQVSNRDFVSKVVNNIEFASADQTKKALIAKDFAPTNEEDFSTLIKLGQFLYDDKVKNLVVLIDEVEDLLSAGTNKAILYLTMLRNIYDVYTTAYSSGKKITPISIVLFLSPDAWEVIMMNSEKAATKNAGAGLTPLITRIGNQIYNLREFDKSDVVNFIVMLLNKVSDESDEISPFTTDVIDGLFMITRGNPRRILTNCHSLVQTMLDTSEVKIDAADFKAFCKEKNLEIPQIDSEDNDEDFFGKF